MNETEQLSADALAEAAGRRRGEIREGIARWLVDEVDRFGLPAGWAGLFYDELPVETRARLALAADDLMTGLLAGVLAAAEGAERVRALHAPFRIYEPCGHPHSGVDLAAGRAVDCGDFFSCAAGYRYAICAECCTAGRDYGQTEECVVTHGHGPDRPICPTVGALR